ncbi:ECF RNA polymerase sigma factor SigJ [Streptomyces sp. RB5]|uniref:ECF RNA polymerase sigma factor SigJ n=1 Tax=Streptomyces smaragdinus TaxID=2585196 RepID=A0A7K0CEU3_9ACTN|nr:sigma-70 family RNA polymerase sigma factor [Streptomyces smaragdinus]MQY11988.1 ECF RNA polymerase sigma factor SigJ [Streptomyces smaragdinus]
MTTDTMTDRSQADHGAEVFTAAAPRLLAIGTRVLRDPGEAEDVVQEAWLRWARTDRSAVRNPSAFLALTTSRLALNVVQSAHRRRETPAGPWLPERTDDTAGPETTAERRDEVDAALRMLLERLTATEQAVYLLRTAFGHPYSRLARLLGLSEGYARQVLLRARGHLAGPRRHAVDALAHRRLVRAFLAAAHTGDLDGLEELLVAGCQRTSLEAA